MRRCNYELSRVMGMRRWLTVMNATVISDPIPEADITDSDLFEALVSYFDISN